MRITIKNLFSTFTTRLLPLTAFSMYDFKKNGKIDYNDWIYLDLEHNEQYRLLATTPTPNNAFGFANIAPVTLPKNPDGYFVFIKFAKDDSRFS